MPRPRRVRVSLKGPEAELGRVLAVDVGRLLIGLERAVAQAATVVVGGHVRRGRRAGAIEISTRFRLVNIESGSVTAVLDLPQLAELQPSLDFEESKLSDIALEEMLLTLEGRRSVPQVAEALVQLADDVSIGSRYDALVIEAPRTIRRRRRRVRLDEGARDRLRIAALEPPAKPGSVVGRLVEADFERMTAQVRPPTGPRVDVTFTDELSDDIQAALRDMAELEGFVVYDPITSIASRVKLRSIRRGEQLALADAWRFWRSRPIAELASEQGVRAIQDVSQLQDALASPEEVDAFLAALSE